MQEFPPESKLDSKVYGDQTSTIRKKHIESNMDGLTVNEAIFNFDMIFCDFIIIFYVNFARAFVVIKVNSFFFI